VTTETAVNFGALVRLAADVAHHRGLAELLPATPGRRTWTALETPLGWDAWLIAWPEGTDTGWHDHQGSAGVFTVAEGTLTEFSMGATGDSANTPAIAGDVVGNWRDVRTRYISAGESRTFGPKHIHHVVNETGRIAYSVHVYAPVLRGMTRYKWRDDDLLLTDIEAAGSWQG
jgi:hypothetical protein